MNNKNYDDIINLPHHISKKRPQMSIEMRAAQFAPFAALTGFEDEVIETARLTDEKTELNEEQEKELNMKLQLIQKDIQNTPKVTITYFVPDVKKAGGQYKTVTGNVKKIDMYNRKIVLTNKMEIPIPEIIEI